MGKIVGVMPNQENVHAALAPTYLLQRHRGPSSRWPESSILAITSKNSQNIFSIRNALYARPNSSLDFICILNFVMASSNKTIVAFDLYGTLLSTESIATELASHFGNEKAQSIAGLWRRFQLEYTWRMNSMCELQYHPTLPFMH
jgi:hypothetical protein